MNKINVLYKNVHFKSTSFEKGNEKLQFDSELMLNDLLKQASITNYDKEPKKPSKKDKAEAAPSVFKRHPRNFPDDSMLSVDTFSESLLGDTTTSLFNDKFKTTRELQNAEALTKKIEEDMLKKINLEENNLEPALAKPMSKPELQQKADILTRRIEEEMLKRDPTVNVDFEEKKCEITVKKSKSKPLVPKSDETVRKKSGESVLKKIPPYNIADFESKTMEKHGKNVIPKECEVTEIQVTDDEQEEKSENGTFVVTTDQPLDSARENALGTKLNTMLTKISALLKEIREVILNGILPDEGAEDLARREKRALEFSSRFARNYLYQLGRQVVDIRKYIRPITPRAACSYATSFAINQRLINSHQIVMQALQAYKHYVPNSVASAVQNKFQELLTHICDLCKIMKKIKAIYNINVAISSIVEVENNTKSVLQHTQDYLEMKAKISIKKAKNIKTPRCHTRTPINPGPYENKQNSVNNRLSMYSMAYNKSNRGNTAWKKNAAALAKQRFNVQSRYKPGTYKPVVQRPDMIELPRKTVAERRSSKCLDPHFSPVPSKINEDDIQTLVEMETKKDKPSVQKIERKFAEKNNLICLAQTEIKNSLEPLLQNLLTEMKDGGKEQFVDHSSCNDMLDKLKGLLDQMQGIHTQLPIADNTSCLNSRHYNTPTNTHRPKNQVTVTGAKNAQLICIKDKSCYEEESAVAIFKDGEENNGGKNDVETVKIEPAQSVDGNQENSEVTLENVKINPKTESRFKLENLSKKTTINVIQYKLEFHKYTKPNQMYKKSATIQPWILLSQISDNLLNNLLVSVLSEVDLNEIVAKVYRSEFE